MKKIITIFLVLIIILIIAICVAFGYGYKKIKNIVLENSQEQAIALPQISIGKTALQDKRKSFDDFADDLEDGKCENQYELTGEEANVVVKDFNQSLLTKWIYLNVHDSQLDALFSVPLKGLIPSDDFDNKFINGSLNATFGYNLNGDKKFIVKLSSLKIGNDEKITGEPKDTPVEIRDDLKKMLESVDKIYLENDRIIIKCKE